jgi:uncharacterized protein (UPF0305 family)
MDNEAKLMQFEEELEQGKELVNVLGNYVNYRKSTQGFIEAFKREHRTLQQSSFRMMLSLIEEMASDNYHTDGRNETSKQVAKMLIEGFKEMKKREFISQGETEEKAEFYANNYGNKPSQFLPYI